MRHLVALVAALLSTGCPGLSAGSGARPDGHRLVEGRVRLSEDFHISRQVTGVQLAAVAISEREGEPTLEVFPSDVLQPDKGRGVPFALSLPESRAFHLVLQIPGAGQGAGRWLGLLRFSDGNGREVSLIPAGGDLDLALIDTLEVGPGYEDNELQGQSSHNPLAQIDSDQDGVADSFDDDDDGDGALDVGDSDVAGDGIDDVFQELSALPDGDADGVPDAFDPEG